MICRCVISGLLLMLVFLMLFLRPGKEALQSRSLAAAALSTRNDTEPRPATAATTNGAPARRICRFEPVSLRAVSYNRNCNTPRTRSRFRDDNCVANARLSPTTDQNIFPNRDALPQVEGDKSKFPPNALRLWHRCVPSACRTNTRRPRLTHDQECDLRSL